MVEQRSGFVAKRVHFLERIGGQYSQSPLIPAAKSGVADLNPQRQQQQLPMFIADAAPGKGEAKHPFVGDVVIPALAALPVRPIPVDAARRCNRSDFALLMEMPS